MFLKSEMSNYCLRPSLKGVICQQINDVPSFLAFFALTVPRFFPLKYVHKQEGRFDVGTFDLQSFREINYKNHSKHIISWRHDLKSQCVYFQPLIRNFRLLPKKRTSIKFVFVLWGTIREKSLPKNLHFSCQPYRRRQLNNKLFI